MDFNLLLEIHAFLGTANTAARSVPWVACGAGWSGAGCLGPPPCCVRGKCSQCFVFHFLFSVVETSVCYKCSSMKGRIHANIKIISMTVNHSFIFPILTLYIPSAIRYVCDFYRFSAGSCFIWSGLLNLIFICFV